MWSFVLRVATFPFAIIWHICKFFWYIWWYYWHRTGKFFPPTPNAPTVLIQPTYHTGVKGPRYPIPPPGSPVPTPPPEPAPEPMPPFPDPTPSKKYLDATPQIERLEGELFVNILSAVKSSKQDITLLFDGYRNAVPDSNAIHPQQSAAGINQVYWYIKPSPVSPNAYSIKQRYTGRILTYPKSLTADSRLTVEEASDSLWEIREVGDDYNWVLTPRGTSLALTLSADLRQITLQPASSGNRYQQWVCPLSKSN